MFGPPGPAASSSFSFGPPGPSASSTPAPWAGRPGYHPDGYRGLNVKTPPELPAKADPLLLYYWRTHATMYAKSLPRELAVQLLSLRLGKSTPAAVWFLNKRNLTGSDDGGYGTDYESFISDACAQYTRRYDSITARRKIAKLKQTGAITGHNARYLELNSMLGGDRSSTDEVVSYLDTLKPEVYNFVIQENVPPDLSTAMERAERYDAGYTVRMGNKPRSGATPMDLNAIASGSSSPRSSADDSDPAGPPDHKDLVNAVLAAINSKYGSKGKGHQSRPKGPLTVGPCPAFTAAFPSFKPRDKMTDDMKKFCRENNLCYYCKGIEHSSSDCPAKKGSRRAN